MAGHERAWREGDDRCRWCHLASVLVPETRGGQGGHSDKEGCRGSGEDLSDEPAA
jgi:hypothetical protein